MVDYSDFGGYIYETSSFVEIVGLDYAIYLADKDDEDTFEMNDEELKVEEFREEKNSHWLKKLGQEFTNTPAMITQKAQRIQVSLERILDERTKKNLVQVEDEDKEDIYSILRWMMRDYKELSK